MWFTLVKREQTTVEALNKLARCFRVPTKTFSFCGLKDRRGITTQQISFPVKQMKEVERVFDSLEAATYTVK